MSIIGSDGDARLRLRLNFSRACGKAIWTSAIPLRQAATRRAPENSDTNDLPSLDQTAAA